MAAMTQKPVVLKLEFPTEDMPHPLPQVGDKVVLRGKNYNVKNLEWNFDQKLVYVVCEGGSG